MRLKNPPHLAKLGVSGSGEGRHPRTVASVWGLFKKRSAESDEQQHGSSAEQSSQDSYSTEPLPDFEQVRRRLAEQEMLSASELDDASGAAAASRITSRAMHDEIDGDVKELDDLNTEQSASEFVTSAVAQRQARRRAEEERAQQDSDAAAVEPAVEVPSGQAAAGDAPNDDRVTIPSVPSREEIDAAVETIAQQWLDELAVVGGAAPLRYFSDEAGTFIELTSAHPGGIAMFAAGKTTHLSNLVRETHAFREARDAADLIAQKSVELLASRAMSTVQLATGIAEWTHEGIHHRAPVLIRPVTLRRVGRDYEVALKGRQHVNPSLVQLLARQHGIRLHPATILELAQGSDSFLPQQVFEHVRHEGAHISGFSVSARAVIASFGDAADAMLDDARLPESLDEGSLAKPGTNILRALAGDPRAVHRVARAQVTPEDRPSPDLRDPASERLLLDADTEQERIVDAISAGNTMAVETLPGTGLTQTVVNSLGQLVADGKRVLVVSPRSSSLRAIRQRLRGVGLEGLAVTPRTLRRDAIAAIARNEKAERPSTGELDDALVRLRHVLVDYRAALTNVDPSLGVSALDALEELSRLELIDEPPATTARIDREGIERIARRRDEAASMLRELGALGQFKYGPDDSPWYGVSFASTEETREAKTTAKRLAESEVAEIVERARELISRTHLRPAETFAELGIYLRLLVDIRETLDRFKPDVFDRSLTELIKATGPRRDNADMTSQRRRQLRQLARDYVRPGLQPGELHEALTLIQRQRILWHRYVEDGAAPEVPTGIEEVRAEYRRVAGALQSIDGPLMDAGRSSLANLPFDELFEQLDELAAESEVLNNLQERLRITEQLDVLGLGELVHDLAERHVAPELVDSELELAWWQSVLEDRLKGDKALLNANTRVLTRLESDFRVVDQAHTESSAGQLAWSLAESWKVALVDYQDEAEALRGMLRKAGVSSRMLATHAGHLSRSITPVWLTTPYDVPLISDDIEFDVVMIVDAGTVSVAEAVGAIRRGRQLVAFGDPVTEFPASFSIAVEPKARVVEAQEASSEAELRAREEDSIFNRLAQVAPVYALTRSYRAGGEDLAELVNNRFYEGRIRSIPWAGTFLGYPSLSYSFVEGGTGMADEITGAVESPDAEVTRVIELVIDHAIHRPRESLMVITASTRHARRVNQAVYSLAAKRPELTSFLTHERGEPFVVTTLEQASGLSRDRVLFSLGFGRTPHGRVLSSFGILSSAHGERALAIGMTRARRSLTIISSLAPSEFDPSRMTRGTLGLAQILGEAEERANAAERRELAARTSSNLEEDEHAAPMLLDLARRLHGFGMRVELAYRERVPLVAAYGGRAIAIDTDGLDAVVAADREPTLRESLRLRPELLKRLGWYYIRVHAFELFADPDAVARRIAVALQVPIPSERDELDGPRVSGELQRGSGHLEARPDAAELDAPESDKVRELTGQEPAGATAMDAAPQAEVADDEPDLNDTNAVPGPPR